MKIVSLQPTATEILVGLGLGDQVIGVSHECELDRPVLIRSRVDSDKLSAEEIDRRVREISAKGESVYEVDGAAMAKLDPDMVFLQSVCEVCATSPKDVLPVLDHLPRKPKLVTFHTHSIQDAFNDIAYVGEVTGTEARAGAWISELKDRLDKVREKTRGRPARKVFCVEWFDPIFNTGHWVPEMVELAGGRDDLASREKDSRVVEWEEVLAYRPERIICFPCGVKRDRARSEMHLLTSRPGWTELPAVRDGHVYLSDGSKYFNGGNPRLVDGVELLAEICHPEAAGNPSNAGKFERVS